MEESIDSLFNIINKNYNFIIIDMSKNNRPVINQKIVKKGIKFFY